MKKILLLSAFCLFTLISQSQSSIAAARSSTINSTVIIKGVVINGAEMGTIRYIQDNVAGISAFSSTLSSLNRGDSVQISGVLTEYKNLLEISTTTTNPAPITFTNLGMGITQTPSVITTPQFNEAVEGRLIKFIGCTFSAAGTFSTGTNYTVNTSAGTFVARVTSSLSSLFSTAIPTGTVDIVGIGSQFCSSPTSGCTTGYQLALRDINDITNSSIGIREYNEMQGNFSLYPNPVSGSIHIYSHDIKSFEIEILDITGKILRPKKINEHEGTDVTGLAPGIYFMKIYTENKIPILKKFIKE